MSPAFAMVRRSASRLALLVAAGVFLAAPPSLGGEQGLWLSAEGRIPLAKGEGFRAPTLRIEPEVRFRFTEDDAHADTMRLRAGLIWDWEYLRLPAQAVLLSNRAEDGGYYDELRGEIEPTPRFTIGHLQISDRNRAQLRVSRGETEWKLQNRLRFRFQPKHWAVWPFVQDEWRLDLERGQLEENRAGLGLGFRLGRGDRFDVVYILQSRRDEGAWIEAHVFELSFLFTAPQDRD